LVASGENGETYFSGALPETDTPAAPSSGASPARALATPLRAAFDAPPGRLLLKLTVEDRDGQVLEKDERDVPVPDLSGANVALSTPAVCAARTALDYRRIVSDPDSVPTPGRQFSRTERLIIRFSAYGPPPSPPVVTARLLNRNGDEMSPLEARASGTKPSDHTLELPLMGLPPGQYVVEIKAKGQTGEATEMVAIKVTG
jgi:hypothetical protein